MTLTSGAAVLELLGPPGVGKSTLAAGLAGAAGVAVVKDHAPGDLPALARGVLAGGLPLLRPPAGVRWARWAAWQGRVRAAPAVAARRHAQGFPTVVFDQGPAYTLMQLRYAADRPHPPEWWADRAEGVARLLDVLVLLDAAPGVLAERVHDRAKDHPAARLSGARLRSYVDRERARCRLVGEELARHGTAVLHLDTARHPPAEQVGLVLDTIPR